MTASLNKQNPTKETTVSWWQLLQQEYRRMMLYCTQRYTDTRRNTYNFFIIIMFVSIQVVKLNHHNEYYHKVKAISTHVYSHW